MVRPEHDDPFQRWQAIVDFYSEFAAMQGWEFLRPMVDLVQWVQTQPDAANLFPLTSHASLCVSMTPGYNPDLPFFSVSTEPGSRFQFRLSSGVGKLQRAASCSESEKFQMFAQFVSYLASAE